MFLRNFIVLSLLTIVLMGCTQNDNDTSLPEEEQPNQLRNINVQNSNPQPNNDLNYQEIAERLAEIASHVPNVNQASAIVLGPYAVVGIDVDEDLDRSRVGTIKYTVSEALYHDPYGKTAIVVADGDILARIQSMNENIQKGQPIQGIMEELSAIISRYMPEFPIIHQPAEQPDQNKEIISEEDREKLRQQEDEQSHDHRSE